MSLHLLGHVIHLNRMNSNYSARLLLGVLKNIFIILDLRCSVNFCFTAKWPSHTHIYIFFFSHPPSCSITSDSITFPGLYSRIALLIHSKCKSLHLLKIKCTDGHLGCMPPLCPLLPPTMPVTRGRSLSRKRPLCIKGSLLKVSRYLQHPVVWMLAQRESS